MVYDDFSDASLMVLVCSGKHDAFAEIVARHTDRYYLLAFRTLNNVGDAEDVVQNAFIKLWQKPTAWNSEKSQFTTWFYRVVINACHDHLRKRKHQILASEEIIDAAVEPALSEQALLESSQQNDLQDKRLREAIISLPSSQRDVINLVVFLELPQRQAAEVMGVSLKAVESLLVRAKRNLCSRIENQQNEQPVALANNV